MSHELQVLKARTNNLSHAKWPPRVLTTPYWSVFVRISRRTNRCTSFTNRKNCGSFAVICSGSHSPLLSNSSHSLQCRWRSVCKKVKEKNRLIDVTTSSEEYITTLLTKSMDNLTSLESSGSMVLYLVGDVRTDNEVNVRPWCMCVVEVIY